MKFKIKQCAGIGVGHAGYDDPKLKCMKHGRKLFYTGWAIGGSTMYSCPVAHIEKCEQMLVEGKVTRVQVDAERKTHRVPLRPLRRGGQ